MSNKCKKCGKAVYANDPQINLDGFMFHRVCARCEDCSCVITVQNFCMDKSADGETATLLCKTHYARRFQASGGTYTSSSDKYSKRTSREIVLEKSPANYTPPVKAAIIPEKDNDYKLDRSVTTPDKRPSLKPVNKPKEAEENSAPELLSRRASLRSTNTKIKEEIAATALSDSVFVSPLKAATEEISKTLGTGTAEETQKAEEAETEAETEAEEAETEAEEATDDTCKADDTAAAPTEAADTVAIEASEE